MTPDPSEAQWFKSSFSGGNNDCVEVAHPSTFGSQPYPCMPRGVDDTAPAPARGAGSWLWKPITNWLRPW